MDSQPVPRATYRLQLSKTFTFCDAAALAPYLEALGISHAYLSPILKARPGSTHGYDTVDHSVLNPELGTHSEFVQMARTFRAHGLGIILDIVPNHMGIGGAENAQWLDVLRWGPRSRFADWFDINWSPSDPSLKNKVLVPFLGTSFGEALDRGAIKIRAEDGGNFAAWIEGAHCLPICPDTYSLIDGEDRIEHLNSPAGREDLVQLIAAQHWRPARYSVAADDINYRRFFIVSDLAAIRIERQDVFDHVHRLPFELIADGLVDGLRVDHIDGLYDPKQYCQRVRQRSPRPIYLIVEKILATHESLRGDWGVDGTTGYEFASAVTRLLTDPAGEERLTRAYEDFTHAAKPLSRTEADAKRAIMDYEMAAELDGLALMLRQLAATSEKTADLTRNAIRIALRETIATLPVYRTYVSGEELHLEDKRDIAVAVAAARRAAPEVDPATFDFLNVVMTGQLCQANPDYDEAKALDAARRIQQYSGPVMAKGLEDTALYRYNRLIALSDVGEKPDRFTSSVAAFHEFNLARAAQLPHSMLTTSSHDTKRGEDARARIAALSGYADVWTAAVHDWTAVLADDGVPEIEPNEAYYFFQLLLGAWPTDFDPGDATQMQVFRDRLDAAMLKSVREARLHTNWNVPRTDYEEKVSGFVKGSLGSETFIESFAKFERTVGTAGAQNGLIEATLKLTVPGVPDIYQGAEFWEQSMVDPDNRRSVDFTRRRQSLSDVENIGDLASAWRDGRIKQAVIQRILRLRRKHPKLFARGSYEPIEAGTEIISFVRRDARAVVAVTAKLYPWRALAWDARVLKVSADIPLRDILTGRPTDSLRPSELFCQLPVSILVSEMTD